MKQKKVKTIGVVGGNLTSALICLEATKKGIETILLEKELGNIATQFATKHIIGYLTKENIERMMLRVDALVFCTSDVAHIIKDINMNIPTYPAVDGLNIIGNRLEQLTLATALDIPTPHYHYQDNREDIFESLEDIALPFTFYQIFEERIEVESIFTVSEVDTFVDEIDESAEGWLIENINAYKKILTITLLKDTNGKVHAYPVIEECIESEEVNTLYMPANISKNMMTKVSRYSKKLLKTVDSEGLFTIRFGMKANKQIEFLNITPGVTIGEIATMHYTDLSIYEQLINIICGVGACEPKLLRASKVIVAKEDEKIEEVKLPYHKYVVGQHSAIPIEIYVTPIEDENV